jgi:hypothetical protein
MHKKSGATRFIDRRLARWTSAGSKRGILQTTRSATVLVCVLTVLGLATLPAYASVPGNDDFDNATVITGLPFDTQIDTSQATRANDDPTDCVGSNTVWYSYTPSGDTRVELDTSGSDYNAVTSVWTGQRGSLQQIACAGPGTLVHRYGGPDVSHRC